MTGPGPTTFIVVFDVNVYLDVARYLGEPYSRARFNDEIVAITQQEGTRALTRAEWSLLALAVTSSGRLVGASPLEVWTSDHIDGLVFDKAQQPNDPGLEPEECGLGWSEQNAESLVEELVWDCVDRSGGGQVRVSVPRGSPPLSHEDGLVYATARDAAGGNELAERIVVTSDEQFLREPGLCYPRVWRPARFVQYVRAERSKSGMAAMPRPRRL